jgi:hypothetical protein
MIRAAWWSAKPRARVHMPSSTSRASRNARRPVRPNTLHAAITSAAGSPTPVPPKSMTAQLTVADQHVGPQQVGVYPHRRSFPGRRFERPLPGGGRRVAVYDAPRRLDRRARDGVEFAERPAPAAGCPCGIYLAQLGHEPREIPGRLLLVVDEIVRIRSAVDPPVDRPGEGVRARGMALSDRLRHPQRQVWGELREPAPLFFQVLFPSHSSTRGRRAQR